MKFTKMQGLGNDYIYVNCLEDYPEGLPALARELCQRRISVGADGIICICPSEVADFRMEMYNADGSQGEMCGNGIRCVGKYLFDQGITRQRALRVETGAGIRTLWLHIGSDNLVEEVTVDMGVATVGQSVSLQLSHQQIEGIPVSVGNPHFVIFGRWEEPPVEALGRLIECHSAFPNRTNVEFAHAVAPDCLEMRVWERGSGETLACGTGACAVYAAAHSLGLCGEWANVKLLGGTLRISREGENLFLRGGAVTVYEGVC